MEKTATVPSGPEATKTDAGSIPVRDSSKENESITFGTLYREFLHHVLEGKPARPFAFFLVAVLVVVGLSFCIFFRYLCNPDGVPAPLPASAFLVLLGLYISVSFLFALSATILKKHRPIILISSVCFIIFCSLPLIFGRSDLYPNERSSLWVWNIIVIVGTWLLLLSSPNREENTESSMAEEPFDEELSQPLNLENETLKAVLKWAENDSPITDRKNDIFGTFPIAQRIAKLLEKNENSSIGLAGAYGTGKSSIVNMVKQMLAEKDDILFCEVPCWGFAESRYVLQEILESIVRKLREAGIDGPLLQQVPRDYMQALYKSGGSGWNILFRLLGAFYERQTSPKKVLEALRQSLKEKRLVVVVEDVDRDEHPNFSMAEVNGVLMNLKGIGNLSLLIVGPMYGGGKEETVYDKLCDHIEVVPFLQYHHKSNLFKKIGAYHTSKDAFLDDVLLDHETHKRHNLPSDRNIATFIGYSNSVRAETTIIPGEEAWQPLMSFISTPRKLKQCIRHLNASWQRLHGECDYVDLLILTILKYARFEFYAFIYEHIEMLRHPELLKQARKEKTNNQNNAPSTPEEPSLIKNQKEMIRSLAEAIKANNEDVWDVLDSLFPRYTHELRERRWSPPNISERRIEYSGGAVDYYARIVSETIEEASPRDQQQLRAFIEYNEKDNIVPMVELLSNAESSSDRIHVDWLGYLDGKRIPELTKHVILRSLEKRKLDMNMDGGTAILCYQWNAERKKEWRYLFPKWYELMFREILPKNMKFAVHFFEQYCRENKQNIDYEGSIKPFTRYGLPDGIDPKEISDLFVKSAKAVYKTPKAIVDACFFDTIGYDRKDESLFHIIDSTCRSENKDNSYNDIERWKWLPAVLLKGLKHKDNQIKTKIHCLTWFLIYSDRKPTPFYDLLFNNKAELLRWMQKPVQPLGAYDEKQINLASKITKEWLSTLKDKSSEQNAN